jgi:hypothetical protein
MIIDGLGITDGHCFLFCYSRVMQFSPLSDNHYATEALKKLLYNGMNIEILIGILWMLY